MRLPKQLQTFIELYKKLPGVGEKAAFRHALILLRWKDEEREKFLEAIASLSEVVFCSQCGNLADEELCLICRDGTRDQSMICVVEGVSDLIAIEKSGRYSGYYFVLGGTLNPLKGIGPHDLELPKLFALIKKMETKSLLLALSYSLESDATCAYIKDQLQQNEKCQIDRIGFGIPLGSNLDYLDSMTIGIALENRRKF